jgi:hypothetical protein
MHFSFEEHRATLKKILESSQKIAKNGVPDATGEGAS